MSCDCEACLVNKNEKIPDKKNLENIKEIVILSLGIIGLILSVIFKNNKIASLIIGVVTFIILTFELFLKAVKNIIKGEIFDENFLMIIAGVGAVVLGEFIEGIMVLLLFRLGEFLSDKATDKSQDSIKKLLDINPEKANLIIAGVEYEVPANTLKIDNIIRIKTGDKVPCDAKLVSGSIEVDMSVLSGESKHILKNEGDEVLAGSVCLGGVTTAVVVRDFKDSATSKIIELVTNARKSKSKAENFIKTFAKFYTPIVVGIACFVGLILPLFFGFNFAYFIKKSLVFLVVSCPCSLVISIPLSFITGLGLCSKKGVLIKGGNYLDTLSNVNTIAFDKTGTLTENSFEITKNTLSPSDFNLLLSLEKLSNHTIAKSIAEKYKGEVFKCDSFEEKVGRGIKAKREDKIILCGNYKLLKEEMIEVEKDSDLGIKIYLAVDGELKGWILLQNKIKEGSKEAISALKRLKVKKCIMLTGDGTFEAMSVGKELGLDEIHSSLMPEDKLNIIKKEKLLGKVCYVGDGINDAPSLVEADIGIAISGLEIAQSSGDAVIMSGSVKKVAESIKIAKNVKRVVFENIIFSLAIKVAVMILGFVGTAPLYLAVFADVGVSILAILNASLRLRHMKGID